MNPQVQKDLEDALGLINKAAREESEELKNIIQGKYQDVKKIFGEKKEYLGVQLAHGAEAAKHTISNVDKTVHENPWPYLAGVAVGGFLLGFLLHRSDRR